MINQRERILGIGLEQRGYAGGLSNVMKVFLVIFPRLSLHRKLVLLQYRRKYKYDL